MRWLENEQDWMDLLGTPTVVLFVFVEWSTYAADSGLKIIEAAERAGIENFPRGAVSWWAGDFGYSPSRLEMVIEWLRDQERKHGIRMTPVIGTGNGSLVWIQNGEVVGFELSAYHLGAAGVLQRTRAIFDEIP